MSSIYERLGINFDTSKFGEAEKLSKESIDYYKSIPFELKDWQYEDVANDTADRNQYFTNPLTNICTQIKLVSGQISQNSSNVIFENNPSVGQLIPGKANDLFIEIDRFKSHTDNVSGVSVEISDPGIPSYDLIAAIGSEITGILVREEDFANTAGLFGSMTSLFIEPDLQGFLTLMTTNLNSLNNSLRIEFVEDPEDPELTVEIISSNLTSQQVNTLYNNVNSTHDLILTRRLEDWQFFQNSIDILSDFSTVTRFSSIGNTQKFMINNYIGTEKLKNIIANT
jgi:hypothetical protein